MLTLSNSHFTVILSIIIIGSRQITLATLFHDAAHGTLLLNTKLNNTIGRIFCGWTIFQSLRAYKASHALKHHRNIVDKSNEPDLYYMTKEGVYDNQTRYHFIWKFFILPFLGGRTLSYVKFLLVDRFLGSLREDAYRHETIWIILFHSVIITLSIHLNTIEYLLFWYVPFMIVHPVIGWFSELSEHFPMMKDSLGTPLYSSRNRYAGPIERFIIGMHGDNYHLTHHLLPGVPHWNLAKATAVLRNNEYFREWDNTWGGIFSSRSPKNTSLIKYIINEHEFETDNTCFKKNVRIART